MALLAYLAITGQPHSREALMTLFWPDHEAAKARANLRRDLSRLKQILSEAVLQVDRKQVSIIPQSFWLDVADFQVKTALAQKHKHAPEALCAECLQAMETAVAAYSGEFMAGFELADSPEFSEWQFFQREGYRQLLAHHLQQLIGWYRAQQNYDKALAYGRGWLAIDPYHEPAHRELMQLYMLNDQQSAALRQYEECVRLLAEELEIEPDTETTALFEAIKEKRFPAAALAVGADILYTPPPEERYEQGSLLAEGGHGEVYHGRDRVTGEPVVIKRLKPELGKVNPEVVTRFAHEGELLSQLNHPNIVRMLATMERDGQHLLVMEYVPGGTLRDLLNETRPLPLPQVLDIALELADALSRAHHLNIVHRDLKPENILLAADGTPRLTDFGVALLQNQDARLTRPGSFIGSPAYMSPEMLQNKQPDTRSDIWSFGVLLYEMLTGRNPFEAEQMTAVLMNILNQPIPPILEQRPDVPVECVNLLERMLVKERDGRLSSMRQVAAELEAIRAGRPVTFTPASAFTPYPTTTNRPLPPPVLTPSIIPPHNIPSDPTPILGREEELEHIKSQLADDNCRLLTIVAMGGMGKTRLAVSAAKHFQKAAKTPFVDGVVFVSFVGIDEVEVIPATLVKALDLRLAGQDDPMNTISNYLSDKKMLLVLDNCEQLVDGVMLFNELLQNGPGIKLLVTSREPLNIEAEWRFDLEGLSYPLNGQLRSVTGETLAAESRPQTGDQPAVSDYAAVQLFIQTARQVQAGFALTPDNTPPILELCRRVAGMPLAIKLAATWLRVMSPERIVEEVARNMDILTSRMRDLPPRQRSMRAVFEQTWDLLTPDEQDVFQSLSVFRGGFSESAAEAVIGLSHFFLVGLVERGLVMQRDNGRYEIHELTRQFAADKLKECGRDTAVLQQHGQYYLQYVAAQKAGLHGQTPNLITREMRLDFENIRQAWHWGVTNQELDLIESTLDTLSTFFELAGLLADGEQMLTHALNQLAQTLSPEEGEIVLCRLFIKKAHILSHRGELAAAWAPLQKATPLLESLENDLITAEYYFVSGHLKQQTGDRDGSLVELQKAVDLFEALNDQYWLISSLNYLGDALARKEQGAEAMVCHRRAQQLAVAMGDAREEALAYSFIGHAYYFLEAYEDCLTNFMRANELFEQVDDLMALARTTSNVGHVNGRLGNYEEAIRFSKRASFLFEKAGADGLFTSDILGDAAMALGNYDEARKHYLKGIEIGIAKGQAIAEAFNQYGLGRLDAAMGQYDEAQKRFEKAIAVVTDLQMERYIAVYKGYQAVMYRQMQRLDRALAGLDEALLILQGMGNKYYTGGFLIEKGALQVQRGNFISALALTSAGLELAQEVGRKPAIFDGRLLLVRIHHELGDSEKAVRQGQQLLIETESLAAVAAIHYTLWRITGEADEARLAFEIYQELSSHIPNISYVNRLLELKTAVVTA